MSCTFLLLPAWFKLESTALEHDDVAQVLWPCSPSFEFKLCSFPVKFGPRGEMCLRSDWTYYSRLFKDERPEWKQCLNGKTTHCCGKRATERSVCVCVWQTSHVHCHSLSCELCWMQAWVWAIGHRLLGSRGPNLFCLLNCPDKLIAVALTENISKFPKSCVRCPSGLAAMSARGTKVFWTL